MIIGLLGKKRAGKDTVAATLVRDFGFTRVAFADALKEVALGLDPIVQLTRVEPYGDRAVRLSEIVEARGWELAKETAEVRRTIQRLGVAARSVDPDLWLRVGVDTILRQRDSGPVVVTDVRFPNEAEAIRGLDGLLFRVVRPGTGIGDTHESEVALDHLTPDLTLANDAGVTELQTRVAEAMRSVSHHV